ncbi:MAG TPA: fatty acid--CoA ligase family protein [Acidimicrobiales bacterium]|nr:fatty acid--CoA ligase family protein [Acidimicrobiales bacterium]
MNLLLLLDMAAAGRGDEVAVESGGERLTAAELLASAWTGADLLAGASALAYVGTNGLAFPVGLFAAAAAGVPFVPLNYRLSEAQLHDMLVPLGDALVVAEGSVAGDLAARGHRVVDAGAFVAAARAGTATGDVPADGDAPAVLLHTSGTTAAPKAAVLRHRHLTSYVIGTVEFGGAGPDDAVLVSVPPYHVAGLANLLSNLYLGRRIVYLGQFTAADWVGAVRREAITHAMVVPTMLARIGEELEVDGAGLPSLRALSYGGARTPAPVLQRVMALLPEVDLTNAYGLTETSSTIAVLGPDDHRAARDGDPRATGRLSSAGRVLPTVEVQVRGVGSEALPAGEAGEIWVRGEQVSGEYAGVPLGLDDEGWFPTRDRGWLDPDGYLFIEGRSDDTIIRGGENIAPAEIEEVLLQHPDIEQCAVVGVPDDEWGQRVAAVVVTRPGAALDAAAVQDFARRTLRGAKTPDVVAFTAELPYTETGKLLRRVVQAGLVGGTVM